MRSRWRGLAWRCWGFGLRRHCWWRHCCALVAELLLESMLAPGTAAVLVAFSGLVAACCCGGAVAVGDLTGRNDCQRVGCQLLVAVGQTCHPGLGTSPRLYQPRSHAQLRPHAHPVKAQKVASFLVNLMNLRILVNLTAHLPQSAQAQCLLCLNGLPAVQRYWQFHSQKWQRLPYSAAAAAPAEHGGAVGIVAAVLAAALVGPAQSV